MVGDDGIKAVIPVVCLPTSRGLSTVRHSRSLLGGNPVFLLYAHPQCGSLLLCAGHGTRS